MNRFSCLFLYMSCVLLLMLSAAAQDDVETSKRQIVISKLDDLPADLKQARHVTGRFNQLLKSKQIPADRKYRLTIEQFYDSGHSSSSHKLESYLLAVVPVDDNGCPDGVERFYNPRNPSPDREITWKNGVKHGSERVYAYSRMKGVGQYVRTETPWENGKIHGIKRVRGTNGQVTSECTFVNGLQQGLATGYGPKGGVVSTVLYKNGKKNGKAVYYYPRTKQIKREVVYHDDLINGVTVEYYLNGKLKRKMQVRNSLMHGVTEMYAEDGALARKIYCLDGEIVTESEFNQKYKQE